MSDTLRNWRLVAMYAAFVRGAVAVVSLVLALVRRRAPSLAWCVTPGVAAVVLAVVASTSTGWWQSPECRDEAGELLTGRPECRM